MGQADLGFGDLARPRLTPEVSRTWLSGLERLPCSLRMMTDGVPAGAATSMARLVPPT